MKDQNFNVEEERKRLVLERFKTLNPNSKVILGGDEVVTVKEIIEHVKQEDDFGKKVIAVQIKMLQAFSKGY